MPRRQRLITPSGRIGKALPSPFFMPLHRLLQFEDGSKKWILSELLKPAPAAVKTKSTKRKSKK